MRCSAHMVSDLPPSDLGNKTQVSHNGWGSLRTSRFYLLPSEEGLPSLSCGVHCTLLGVRASEPMGMRLKKQRNKIGCNSLGGHPVPRPWAQLLLYKWKRKPFLPSDFHLLASCLWWELAVSFGQQGIAVRKREICIIKFFVFSLVYCSPWLHIPPRHLFEILTNLGQGFRQFAPTSGLEVASKQFCHMAGRLAWVALRLACCLAMECVPVLLR